MPQVMNLASSAMYEHLILDRTKHGGAQSLKFVKKFSQKSRRAISRPKMLKHTRFSAIQAH